MILAQKPRPIPTLAMTRWEGDKNAGSEKWMERAIKRHGNIKPERLEHRRQNISITLAMIEDMIKKVNISRKMYIADANNRQAEVMENIKNSKAALSESEPGETEQAKAEVVKWENTQRMLVREYESQMMYYLMAIANLKKYSADLEIGCLLIDHLGIKKLVKDRKTGKKGVVRLSTASLLDELCGGVYVIAQAMKHISDDAAEEDDGAGDDEVPETDDGDEILTPEDEAAIEAKRQKGGEEQ